MKPLFWTTAFALVLLSCASGESAGTAGSISSTSHRQDPSAAVSAEPAVTSSTSAPSSSVVVSSTTVTAPPEQAPPLTLAPYVSSISEVDSGLAEQLTPTSWRAGCPVGLEELRLVEVVHLDYSGASATGQILVHQDHAEDLARVFEVLYEARFPLASIQLVDAFGGDDGASMRANNTSAFNCREVAYKPGVWSNHAFGTAIDVNPLVNPYVQGDFVDPPEGAPYVDRDAGEPGMIVADDVVVSAFASIGWVWGGTWASAKDYQHFSANGR